MNEPIEFCVLSVPNNKAGLNLFQRRVPPMAIQQTRRDTDSWQLMCNGVRGALRIHASRTRQRQNAHSKQIQRSCSSHDSSFPNPVRLYPRSSSERNGCLEA